MSDKTTKTLQTVSAGVGIATGAVSLTLGVIQLVEVIKQLRAQRKAAAQATIASEVTE